MINPYQKLTCSRPCLTENFSFVVDQQVPTCPICLINNAFYCEIDI